MVTVAAMVGWWLSGVPGNGRRRCGLEVTASPAASTVPGLRATLEKARDLVALIRMEGQAAVEWATASMTEPFGRSTGSRRPLVTPKPVGT